MAAATATQRRKQQKPASAAAAADPAAAAPPPPASTLDLVRFAALQHGGFVLCILGIALLVAGYEADWMHPTLLSLTSLGLCLLGLFMHETRPVNVSPWWGAG